LFPLFAIFSRRFPTCTENAELQVARKNFIMPL